MTTYEMQDRADREVHGYTPDEMSTGERTGAAKLKWVVIVDRSLSPGQAVNAAVCVSAATAPAVPGLLGPGGPDASDQWHPGLPWAGCSILAASSAQLAAIRQQAIDRRLLAADMPAAAQATRVYDDYPHVIESVEERHDGGVRADRRREVVQGLGQPGRLDGEQDQVEGTGEIPGGDDLGVDDVVMTLPRHPQPMLAQRGGPRRPDQERDIPPAPGE